MVVNFLSIFLQEPIIYIFRTGSILFAALCWWNNHSFIVINITYHFQLLVNTKIICLNIYRHFMIMFVFFINKNKRSKIFDSSRVSFCRA